MIKKATRYFNTSGPNIRARHYTVERVHLIEKGIQLVKGERYFTIWAPRQTGKSTYFKILAQDLKELGYDVVQINAENYEEAPASAFFNYLSREIEENWKISIKSSNFGDLQNDIAAIKDRKFVLVIDEIEGLNPNYFGQFLHTIRNLYQDRETHSLKSVILVGVSNIVGVVQDNASPFNIADNLEIPYFTPEETFTLLHMHEEDTGQLFHREVKEKICAITANQPGLVNGFAYQLVERNPAKELIDYNDYLVVEDWYLTEAIDKNISNIIAKAKEYRKFVESLLFTDAKQKYKINDEKIKFLHAHGLIKKDKDGYVEFWVPMYKKAVYDAFYPYTNGESGRVLRNIDLKSLFCMDEEGKSRRLNFDLIIGHYKDYVKRRSFKYFREKDEKTGRYKSIKKAALAYSFETYIQALVQVFEGKSYLEPHSGLGRCDLIINIENNEYVIEFKIFRDIFQFEKGKTQLAYYAKSLGLKEALYLVFVPNTVNLADIREEEETMGDIRTRTYIVLYDEEKDF
ncbi:MAG TPA: AAA-like domain-containing protein [Candidatus Kapabacteria bacterium]|nr:AAA-like domain-containing protein [Candidatus Kapabacteria bacterium]